MLEEVGIVAIGPLSQVDYCCERESAAICSLVETKRARVLERVGRKTERERAKKRGGGKSKGHNKGSR